MQLEPYRKIQNINEPLIQRFAKHPQAYRADWLVTEFIDGDHMAFYADAKTKEFKVATRNRFVDNLKHYSCAEDLAHLYKEWLMRLSEDKKSPIIVYGKAIGGHYGNLARGTHIKTVCEYMEFNELVIHDMVIHNSFIGITALEHIAESSALTIAPILYRGLLGDCTKHPENNLSTIPFIQSLPVNYENEMKGIVIRPLWDLHLGQERLIMKKLNRKYIGKKDVTKPVVVISKLLIEIASYIENAAMSLRLLDMLLAGSGPITYANVPKIAGKYVASMLDKVNYVKYNLLNKEEKHLVNKELNKIAENKLFTIIRSKAA